MVIKSPYPDVEIPDLDIPTFLFEHPRPKEHQYPRDRHVFIDAKSGRGLSLDELHDSSRKFGQGLKEKWGWKKEDVMCIFSANQIDTGIVVWGTQYALGVGIYLLMVCVLIVVSPANPAYTEDELLHQLKDSRAKAIVTIADLLPVAVAAGRRANIPKDRIVVFKTAKDGHKSYTSLFSDKHAESTRGKIHPSDLAFLAYSSGTTGLAKGVILTHRNIVANCLQCSALEIKNMHWTQDRMVSFLPFYHI